MPLSIPDEIQTTIANINVHPGNSIITIYYPGSQLIWK